MTWLNQVYHQIAREWEIDVAITQLDQVITSAVGDPGVRKSDIKPILDLRQALLNIKIKANR